MLAKRQARGTPVGTTLVCVGLRNIGPVLGGWEWGAVLDGWDGVKQLSVPRSPGHHCPPFLFPDSVHCPHPVHFWTLASWPGNSGKARRAGGSFWLVFLFLFAFNFKGLE